MRKRRQVAVSGLVLVAAVALVALVSGCGAGSPLPASAKGAPGEKVYTIVVPDIVCASCAATIRRKLEKMEGVKRIVIDLENKTLEVSTDAAAHPSDDRLRETITAAGYLKPDDGSPEA